MKFTISYSIKRTNCFLTATKEANTLEELGDGFIQGTTLGRGIGDPEVVYLTWVELTSSKTFKPLTSHIVVLSKFYKLKRMGWNLDLESVEKFKKEHFKKNEKKSPIVKSDSMPRRWMGH